MWLSFIGAERWTDLQNNEGTFNLLSELASHEIPLVLRYYITGLSCTAVFSKLLLFACFPSVEVQNKLKSIKFLSTKLEWDWGRFL